MPHALICIIDDDVAIRDALSLLLYSAGYDTCGYESADHFLEQPPAPDIGCMLLDIRMPGLDGTALFENLLEQSVVYPVIFITAHGDIPLAVSAIQKGAFDFLTKPFEEGELLEKVTAAVAHYHDQAEIRRETAEIRNNAALLTVRESDVMELVVEGLANKLIADKLSISPRTVEIHRAHVMEKMEADSIASLVRMVTLAGVISGKNT